MTSASRPLTGRHVLMMFLCGFGLIIAVNVTLAVQAVGTFPGLEVANSYVASQSFEARRSAQEALGWEARATYASGALTLRVTTAEGQPVPPEGFTARIGRPTHGGADRQLAFDAAGRARVTLEPGLWRLDLAGGSEKAPFVQSLSLRVAP
ncbi:FixH family protein [Roseivivax sp. GX 12232]|uniref:FixH family protein n=1 Tax=Roseivivax sp. GX 12232 TaxID=2900547 RepID=UPI001E611F1A|nr:FixH family protein [Roseivivax sp. GX 12232]MCE0504031.1 FixH family protein [Roseivivax sp. GX 12232]